MFSRSIIAAAAAFSLIVPASALYDASSSANLAMYWGQGNNQNNLSYYCDQPSVDIIPIGFVNFFPQQTSGGLPGANYGNACWLDPTYDGSDGHLYERCIWLQENIPSCQAAGKKIILSLGGGNLTYQLTGAAAGTAFATQLWQMYGPYNATYVADGGIRPLDGGYWNDKTDPNYWIDIDGFDFDIELASTDNAAGYIAMLKQLRVLFATNPCKEYLITGSPQCTVPDAAMDAMIQAVAFDALWVQFYNTPTCSARTWASGNSALNTTSGKNTTAGFTYDSWVSRTALGASKNAKIYLGLLGGPAGTTALHSNDFLWPTEATNLIKTYVKDTRFGGVMLWEATVADEQFVKSGSALVNYYTFIKSVLSPYAPKTTASATLCQSTTSSSSSASKTSTTTTTSKTSSSTSSSSSKTSSSTSSSKTSSSSTTSSSTKTSSSTSSSTTSSSASSSKISTSASSSTTSSSSSSSSSSVSSSPMSTSASSTTTSPSTSSSTTSSSSSSSSSSVSSSPTSTSVSSSSTSSTSSVYSTVTPTSSSSSTSVTSTSSSSSSSTVSSPTGLPSDCVYEGCWTEGDNVRALPAISYVDYNLMSEEICYDFCVTQNGYPLFGLEYGGECWCGNALDQSSQNVTDSGDCSMPCDGTPDEFCGSGNRLDVYYCGTGTPSLPTSSAPAYPTSSTVSSTSSSSTSAYPTSSTVSSTSSSSTSAYPTSSTVSSTSSSSTSGYPTSSPTSSESSSTSSESTTSSETSTSSSTSQSSTSSSAGGTSSPTSTPTTSSSSVYSSSSMSAPTSSSTSTVSSSSVYSSSVYSSSSTSVPTSSSSSQSSTSSSAGVTYSPTTVSSSSVYSNSSTSVPTSSSSSTISLSTGTSGPTSSSGTTSGTSIPPYQNSTTVTSTSSSSGSASGSGGVTTTSSSESSSGVVSTPSVTSSSSGVVTTPSSSASSHEGGHHTTPYTTSTVYSTKIYTITSCAPTVTNCPGRLGQVTTEIISLYTTVCPVTETEGSGGETKPTSTPVAPPASYTPYTTSTVYTTKIYTITSCAPTVTNCPAKLGQVTTEVISLYTTVCPVAEATSTPAAPAIPGPGYQQSSAGAEESSYSTTTISSTVTQYRTVKLVKSTATVVPTPVAPYPTGPASSGGVVGTGTGLPSVSLVFIKPSPSTVAGGVTSAAGGVTTPAPSPSTYTGAASKMGGSMIAVVLAAIVALIV